MLLCTNTMHKVAAQIQDAIDVPLLHIVDITADVARRTSLTRLGLLATGFTMEQPFYRERMESHGLELIVPEAESRALVHRVIYEELCRGIFNKPSREQVRKVIGEAVDRGADSIILGCTEIELLIGQVDSPVPVLPTTALHAKAAIKRHCGDVSPVTHPRMKQCPQRWPLKRWCLATTFAPARCL